MNATHRAGIQQCHLISAYAASADAHAFFNLLTGPELFDAVELALPPHRERLLPPTETLSMFLAQALSADRSCQRVVNEGAIKRMVARLTPLQHPYGGLLPRSPTYAHGDGQHFGRGHTGQWLTAHAPAAWHWRGRPVRLVDGATVIMPDTEANQTDFPQPRSQQPGLGFPQCRLVGLICLGSGAVLNAAISACRGKGTDEQSLLRLQLDTLARGDVLLGDAFFATYFLLCALGERGVDAVFEQHGSRQRTTDFSLGQRLGERDHLQVLPKPAIKPDWMSQDDYAQAPTSLTVRELRAGGKTLLTTLLCPKQTSKDSIKRLYRDRWHVELDLRNIKTTLGMEQLSCQTPAMAVKEIWVYLLAYNLIRLMMARAALLSGCLPRQLSSKHTVQVWLAWAPHAFQGNITCPDELFALIARQIVGNRPGRIEPRAIKRRQNAYPLLTKPRSIARNIVRTQGHPKKLK